MTKLLTNDNFFTEHPEKVLGEAYQTKGRFGEITKYKGTIEAIAKIDVPEDFYFDKTAVAPLASSIKEKPADEVTDVVVQDSITKAIIKSKKEIVEKIKYNKQKETESYDEPPAETELLTFSEILKKYNPEISEDELKVFIWYKHQIGQSLSGEWLGIFNPAALHPDVEGEYINKWVNESLLCYYRGKLIPAYLYFAEYVYEKKTALLSEKQTIIDVYGEQVFNKQHEKLEECFREMYERRLMLDNPDETNRLKILPISDFAKEFMISTLDDEKPFKMMAFGGSGEKAGKADFTGKLYESSWKKTEFSQFSLRDAFKYWLKEYKDNINFKRGTNWLEIIEYYLDHKPYNEKRDESRTVYERKKAIAKEEGDRLFGEFLATAIKKADRVKIETVWNEKFNGYKKINYNKVPVAFTVAQKYPANSPMEVRPEKRDAVAFSFTEGSGCLAYMVGAGKTWSAIMIMSQFIDSGYCKRPLLVVPNQTYKQWISEIKGILPHVKINELYNFSQDYIEEITGEEGVIMQMPENSITIVTYEGFKKIGFNENTENNLKSELYEILNQGSREQFDIYGRRKMKSERQKESFMSKLERLMGQGLSKTMINIEDLGIDFICVDEAHSMKKIFTTVKGVAEEEGKQAHKNYDISSGTPSSMGLKGFMLAHYILKNNNQRNVSLLTATPFTNSPMEVYSMLSLIAFEKLRNMGISNLQDFFNTYVQVSYELVINAKLEPQRRQVFMGFNNLVSLQQLIFRFIDFKDASHIQLVRPDKYVLPYKQRVVGKDIVKASPDEVVDTSLPFTPAQEMLMDKIKMYVQGDISYEELQSEHEMVTADTDGIDEEEIKDTTEGITLNEFELSDEEKAGVRMLRGVNFARNLALSPYLYEFSGMGKPNYKSYIETSPKLKYVMGCIKSVKEHHEKKGEPISGQVIYMDRGKDYFELIKEYLVKEIGYKEHEVGIIKSGMRVKGVSQKEAKENIKNKFLGVRFDEATKSFVDIPDEERIKIVIGSSSIKEGINLQRYTSVLYNCFLDWNPTDIVQVEGRIWRQGNTFEAVRIVNPLMINSMDIFMFQKLEEKTARINSIWNTDGKTNVLPTDEFDPKEMKYELISDPRVIAKMEIESHIEEANDHIAALKNEIKTAENIRISIADVEDYKEELAKIVDLMRPAKQEGQKREINTMFSLLDDVLKNQTNWEGEKIFNTYDKYSKQYNEIGIWSYGNRELSKPSWYADLKGSNNLVNRATKEFLTPRGIKPEAESIERFIQKTEAKIKDVELQKKSINSDEAIAKRVSSIIEEREANKIVPATVEERIKDFEKLNYLLDRKRGAVEKAEEFIKVETDACPPIDAEGNRLITPEAIQKLEKCNATLPQTKDLHVLDGEYTEERKKLHLKIIKEVMKGAVCMKREQPIAILTGGVPGSGKTTFLKMYAPYLTSEKIFKIDADEIREMLPEYKGWNAHLTHQETKDIVKQLLMDSQVGIPCKFDILYDGTMNKTKNYIPLIDRFKKLGYKVYIIFVKVPVEVSKKRVLRRYQRTGRYVPLDVVNESNKAGLDAFNTIKKMVSGYVLVDGVEKKVIEQHGEPIPKDREYFENPITDDDKEKARARAIAKIKILKLKAKLYD